MNNKGFAVSTILYGLSIMGFLIVVVLISTMSSNRSNTKDFIQQVEDELNRYASKQTVITPYNNNVNYPQEFFTLEGSYYWYKIELWNNGVYKSATFKVAPNTIVFFYIGDGTTPTIACLDGDSRENCPQGGDKLIMSTEIDGDGINDNAAHEATQGSDYSNDHSGPKLIDDSDERKVYLKGATDHPENTYTYTNASGSKARISLVSLDDEASYLNSPSSGFAGVFYINNKSNGGIYTCNGSSYDSDNGFTGEQNQQWTVENGTATNVKNRSCSFTYYDSTMEAHNALF